MSDDKSIEQRVIDAVAEVFGVDRSILSRTSTFAADLGADDLDSIELLMDIEDEFETSITDAEFDALKSVGELIDFIQQRKA